MTLAHAPTSTDPIGSPRWWVTRLSDRLDARLEASTTDLVTSGERVSRYRRDGDLRRWQRYYDGQLNLALASEKWRAEFAARFPNYSANFMAKVVDKHRERLQVQGIRYGDQPSADSEAWDWWQDNRLDSESLKLNREMLIKGSGYALVWPNEDGIPEVSIESPNETIVETAPGKAWKRLAALKRFVGLDGYMHAELYLPDGVYKFRSSQRDRDFSVQTWARVADWQKEVIAGEDWPIENPVKRVPVVPFVHQPDLRNCGTSKIRPVASIQDAINKLRVDAFVAAEFASFRQRWVIGLDIPLDDDGQPVDTIRTAVDRLWRVPPADPDDWPNGNAPDVKFGEFDVTPLDPFYAAITGEIRMMGAISNIPLNQLLPQSGQPASAEAIQAEESGLVAEVLDDMVNIGESYEELFRLNFLFRGDARGEQRGSELIWRNPASQAESAHIDALVKMRALGVPDQALWEQIQGVTQSTIRRWRVMAASQSLEAALAAPELTAPPSPRAGG